MGTFCFLIAPAMYELCTFEEVDAYSDFTSRIHNKFQKAHKNKKQLGVDANIVCLSREFY